MFIYFSSVIHGKENHNILKHNSVRIAQYTTKQNLAFKDRISPRFLKRVHDSNYNYVLAQIDLTRIFWSGEGLKEIRKTVCLAFQDCEAFNLRFIPFIQMGSKHSNGWSTIKKHHNQNVGMTRICVDSIVYGFPSYAPEPEGTDAVFREILQEIRLGYDSARVSYPLEFIHLGHDEPYFYEYMMVGGLPEELVEYRDIYHRGVST